MPEVKKEINNTFFQKKATKCPVCDEKYYHENLLSTGGRINAGDLTKELHRLYIASEKYGDVYPLIYVPYFCPYCYVCLTKYDTNKFDMKKKQILSSTLEVQKRKDIVRTIIGGQISKDERKTIVDGIAIYIAGMFSYENYSEKMAKTFKQGLFALRAAWLCAHAHTIDNSQNFGYLAKVLYRKATFLYSRSVELTETGEEILTIDSVNNYGPDQDHNFGYDGVIYLASLLSFRYGQSTNKDQRTKKLDQAKIFISKIVGDGKSSSSKPSALLDWSRDLFEQIKGEIKSSV